MKHIQPQGKKQNRSVSLYAHQREAFDKLGGSKWLQQQIDAEIRRQSREWVKAHRITVNETKTPTATPSNRPKTRSDAG